MMFYDELDQFDTLPASLQDEIQRREELEALWTAEAEREEFEALEAEEYAANSCEAWA